MPRLYQSLLVAVPVQVRSEEWHSWNQVLDLLEVGEEPVTIGDLHRKRHWAQCETSGERERERGKKLDHKPVFLLVLWPKP